MNHYVWRARLAKAHLWGELSALAVGAVTLWWAFAPSWTSAFMLFVVFGANRWADAKFYATLADRD